MRVLVVENTRSGTPRKRAQLDELLSRLKTVGIHVDVESPSSADETRTVAASVERDRHEVLLVAGGDGTLHAAVNGLVQTPRGRRPALAILPVGRGNDFAAALGLETVADTLDAVTASARRSVDLGKTEAGVFLGVAGTGFDARAARRAQQTPFLTGRVLYTYAVLRTLIDFRHIEARVRYEGGIYEGLITFAAVGNSRRYGGGMYIAPRADLSDGLLDLCLVRDISRAGLLYMFPSVFSGKHLDHWSVIYRQTPFVEIETAEPAELFADGEYLQTTPARIDMMPGELEIVTPRKGNRGAPRTRPR